MQITGAPPGCGVNMTSASGNGRPGDREAELPGLNCIVSALMGASSAGGGNSEWGRHYASWIFPMSDFTDSEKTARNIVSETDDWASMGSI